MLYCTAHLLILIGCHEEALGMENGKIPDSAIKANYQVNAIHNYTCILVDEKLGEFSWNTHIWFDILTRTFAILFQGIAFSAGVFQEKVLRFYRSVSEQF